MRAAAILMLVAVWGCDSGEVAGETDAAQPGPGADSVDSAAGADGAQALACPAEGTTGKQAGEIILDLEVRRCDGTKVTLHELVCGHELTLVDLGGAAFQECVAATDTYVSDPEFAALRDKGLHIVQIFQLDSIGNPPTPSFCKGYSADHAIDFDFMIDPLGNTHALGTVHPINLVVDGEGRIVYRWEEFLPLDRVDLIDALL